MHNYNNERSVSDETKRVGSEQAGRDFQCSCSAPITDVNGTRRLTARQRRAVLPAPVACQALAAPVRDVLEKAEVEDDVVDGRLRVG